MISAPVLWWVAVVAPCGWQDDACMFDSVSLRTPSEAPFCRWCSKPTTGLLFLFLVVVVVVWRFVVVAAAAFSPKFLGKKERGAISCLSFCEMSSSERTDWENILRASTKAALGPPPADGDDDNDVESAAARSAASRVSRSSRTPAPKVRPAVRAMPGTSRGRSRTIAAAHRNMNWAVLSMSSVVFVVVVVFDDDDDHN
jgi:hypothetical protein